MTLSGRYGLLIGGLLACLPFASLVPYVLISLLPPSLPSAWIIDLAEPQTPRKTPKISVNLSSHESHPAGYSVCARTSHVVCPPYFAVDRADVAYLCAILYSVLSIFSSVSSLPLTSRATSLAYLTSRPVSETSIRPADLLHTHRWHLQPENIPYDFLPHTLDIAWHYLWP